MADSEASRCPLCKLRKPKRWCPALSASICPLCCGRERELSIRCPYTCKFLREARKHEQLADLDPQTLPHPEVKLSREFLEQNGLLGAFLEESIWLAASAQPEVVDTDIREALEALIRTYLTMRSGLIYETKPGNRYAAAIVRGVRERLHTLERRLREETDVPPPRDSQILAMLVFLQRMELQVNNGRPLSRSFLDLLRRNLLEPGQTNDEDDLELDPGTGGLILPA
ncbi:MAG: hypothetical protein U5J83_09615 [Bryobacterales bacterium]|nr:hypothetical protein [Bryobacterales bacterium]